MTATSLTTLEDRLLRWPLRIGHEKQAQADLEGHLETSGIAFSRETPLCPRDTPDFLIETTAGPVVVELKIRAQRKRIFKQMERYASHERIVALFLMTATPMGLPATLNGKPTFVISIGQGWL